MPQQIPMQPEERQPPAAAAPSFEKYGGSAPENYERYFVPAIGAPLALDLVGVAAPAPGERVLDVACGTGVVARLAAERVGAQGHVDGLDPNPGMLAVARAAAPADAGIEWHQASAEDMPLPDGACDLVLCQMGLQFVPDRAAALREMRRVSTSGGRLALNAPGPTPELMAAMGDALARHVDPALAGFIHIVFSIHDADELGGMIADAGFSDVGVTQAERPLRLPRAADFLWQYVSSTPLAAAVGQADARARQAVERDVVEASQKFVDGGGMAMRVRVLTATARAD